MKRTSYKGKWTKIVRKVPNVTVKYNVLAISNSRDDIDGEAVFCANDGKSINRYFSRLIVPFTWYDNIAYFNGSVLIC